MAVGHIKSEGRLGFREGFADCINMMIDQYTRLTPFHEREKYLVKSMIDAAQDRMIQCRILASPGRSSFPMSVIKSVATPSFGSFSSSASSTSSVTSDMEVPIALCHVSRMRPVIDENNQLRDPESLLMDSCNKIGSEDLDIGITDDGLKDDDHTRRSSVCYKKELKKRYLLSNES